ncbi:MULTISPECIES: NmrA family NAD(P)-binding protein [Bacteroidota]|uniref:NAD-dependent dehydratase n=1 Tax=Empedobacter falsenii TaxID=343874 RepID=A0A7H9DRZ9_9FLAO|nr:MULTISPECIES: NmrA family NAD(P)-binding protein [Bacteroidota]MDV4100456.1 NAD-dependent dehydratase [Elizabethkingia anophelis]MBW3524923.1 NmrA family NAD(P)-binding protein [Chryseobacterium sp. NKUCC03_KSP]MCT1531787.1 NmrA family NAD(P)-binding protein [Sphingobacterium daejeonense]MDM1461407.1 NmrA family NAD(P)-binding protein [Myroides odoratimimus]OCK50366.1 NAD-dependent dehydratase [Chryseobacterium sp. CBo1]|tara:strand:+ start:383 stop:1279 length:897 start_codon:yes stop_codon:yes gene_type:complete
MKIVLTGSLGHIGKPLAEGLVAKGHSVTVISSNVGRQNEIEAIGAVPAVGSLEDVGFLVKTFTGANIVYLMEPPANYFNKTIDVYAHRIRIANIYVQAILLAGVTKVVHLSSIGAHTDHGNGMLRIHYEVEQILKELPESVSLKEMRPVGFYYNMFAFIPAIKSQGAIIQNYGGDKKEPWVSPLDIASAIVEEMEKPFNGRTIRYIASDEVSPNKVAQVLGEAIGKPDLKWQMVSDEQFLNALLAIGFNPQVAKGYTEMNASRRTDAYEDYNLYKPQSLGKVKLTDFAGEFATVFNKK